jgi:hypothetical protein
MERNKIIELARQVDLEDADFPFDEWEPVELIAFAKLVAMRTLEGTYDEMIDIVRKDEREACAVLASKCNKSNNNGTHLYIADAIRARSAATSRGDA